MNIFKKALSFINSSAEPKRERLLTLPTVAATGGTRQLTDTSAHWWFSPLEPVQPMAPSDYRPRQYGYLPGANIIWTPKAGEVVPGISFETLRELADAYDILRLVIETRKDQLIAIPFTFRAKQKPGENKGQWKKRTAEDPILAAIIKFFEKPDGFHDFKKWMRMWLEDMLVVDAVALYLQRDKQGRIASIHPIDGATIGRIITEQGFTPPPDQPAYQQVIYGTPACDLTTNELAYSMRNERTCRRYGYSRVEQVLLTINLGLQRKMWQLDYYTSGSTPDAFVFLPSDLPIEKVEEAQTWFDSILAGQSRERRKVRFMPGYGSGDSAKPNIIFPKEVLLKDPIDEWLSQIICFAFSVSQQGFTKMMNRATAGVAQESSEEEGIGPDVVEVLAIINNLLEKMGVSEDYECVAEERKEPDAVKQSEIDAKYLGKLKTTNEIREERGLDPYSVPEADMLGMYIATGEFVPLGQQSKSAQAAAAATQGVDENGNPIDTNKMPVEYDENGDPLEPDTTSDDSMLSAGSSSTPEAKEQEKAIKAYRYVQKMLGTGMMPYGPSPMRKLLNVVKTTHDGKMYVPRKNNSVQSGSQEDLRVIFDNKNANGDDIDLKPDFVRNMTPDEYLNSVLPVIGRADTSGAIEQAIRDGKSIASPTLHVIWDDVQEGWLVVEHDGRHRMMALRNINPNMQVPVRVYLEGEAKEEKEA